MSWRKTIEGMGELLEEGLTDQATEPKDNDKVEKIAAGIQLGHSGGTRFVDRFLVALPDANKGRGGIFGLAE